METFYALRRHTQKTMTLLFDTCCAIRGGGFVVVKCLMQEHRDALAVEKKLGAETLEQ